VEWLESWISDIELCDIISRVVSTYEIPRVDWDYVTNDILYCSVLISVVINLFIFVGNWDILTLLVMGDIIYFMLVTFCGVNVMYGVIFVLVADLVVCIYVIYL